MGALNAQVDRNIFEQTQSATWHVGWDSSANCVQLAQAQSGPLVIKFPRCDVKTKFETKAQKTLCLSCRLMKRQVQGKHSS